MSRQLITTVASLVITLTSLSAGAQSVNDSLNQISKDVGATLEKMWDPSLTNLEKLQMVSHKKTSAEMALRDLIDQADSADLNNPSSPLSRAFKSIDSLTVLSELQVNLPTGKIVPESCSRAQGMLTISNLGANSESADLPTSDRQILALIKNLCVQK